jgi:aminopeptidase N
VAHRRPDALSHPLFLSPRRGLEVNAYDAPPTKRAEVPGGPARPVRTRTFDLMHVALALDVDVKGRKLAGTATLTGTPLAPGLKEIVLDARGFTGVSVRKAGRGARRLATRYDGRVLTVRLDRAYAPGERIEIVIAYRARPRVGMWFVGPDPAYPARIAQAWSQGQAEDSASWFPVHDHPNDKFTSEIAVTADATYRTVANGRLVARTKTDRGRRTTWHWKQDRPHPAYLVALAVAPFVETRARAAGVPLRFYAFPGQERLARRLYRGTAAMMRAFVDRFGPYPWREYSQIVVSEFTWGGMENTGATTLTEKALIDDRGALDMSYDGLVAHELAHQWWGDLVTCHGWHHNWLNESWATFCENLYAERAHGDEAAAWDRIEKFSAYVAQDLGQYRRPIVFDHYTIPMDLFDRHSYEKGSLVLGMLRDELGDEPFFRGARLYLARHAEGFADTHQFRRAMEDASGRDLRGFFEQWVFQAGYPEIEASWRWDGRAKEIELVLTQVQDTRPAGPMTTPVFRFHLDIEVDASRGVTRQRIEMTERTQAFRLAVHGRPLRVAIDPMFRLLKRLGLVQPAESWRRALAKAPQMPERLRAARMLAVAPLPANLRALATALAGDHAPQVRAACAVALGELAGRSLPRASRNANRRALERSLQRDRAPLARRAAAYALGLYGRDAEDALLAGLAHERSYLVKAALLKALAHSGSKRTLAACGAAMTDRGWRDLVPMAALDALAIAKLPAAFDLAYTSLRYGETEEVREAAVRLLVALASDPKARRARAEQARHAAPTVAALLEDPSVFMRLAAATNAPRLKDRALVAPLRRVVRDEAWDHLVRTATKSIAEIQKTARKRRA